jgi:release factor glutamine methyltransferase
MISTELARAAQRLSATSSSPWLDAELLLAEVLGVERGRLRADLAPPLDPAAASAFAALLARRLAGEPLAYLLGRREFWTLTLEVGPAVLVPRPETELLVEWALERLAGTEGPAVLDLGAGSGAIGLAIASERPDAAVDLVEASSAALAVADRNRRRLLLDNARCLAGDWYAPVRGRHYQAILANPPYLASADPYAASAELRHEPREALIAGPSGLEALAAVARGAGPHLVAGGCLIVEHGSTQAAAVRELFVAQGLLEVATRRDLAGLERATLGLARG